MVRCIAIAVVLIFHSCLLLGQQKEIDSLQTVLQKTSDKAQRIDLLTDLANAYYDFDSEKGFEYSSNAYTLSKEMNDFKRMRRAHSLTGYYYFVRGNYDQALSIFRECRALPAPKEEFYGYTLVLTGNVFRTIAQFDSAEYYYLSAEKLFNAIKSENYLPYTYRNLGRLYVLQWKNREAKTVLKKAEEIYKRNGRKRGLADTWFLLSQLYRNTEHYDSASHFLELGCGLSEQTKDEFLELSCLMERGNIKFRLGNYPESLKAYIEALGHLKSKDLPVMVTQVYIDIGDIYRALGDDPIALRYFDEALRMADKLGLPYEKARVYAALANTYRSTRDLVKAREMVMKSLDIRTKIGDREGIATCNSILGQISRIDGKQDDAIRYLNTALQIRREINNREGISSSLFNLSLVYAVRQDFARTLELQKEAMAMESEVGNKFTMGFSNNRLGSLYTHLRQFALASNHLKKAEEYARAIKSPTLTMNNEFYWSEYYEARGNKELALEHYKRYNAAHDSIHNDIGAQKLAELQALYMMDKKDQEIALLSQEKKIQENEIQLQRSKIYQQNIIIVSSLVGLGMLSFIAFIVYRYTNRITKAHREITEQKEEIQAQSEELIDANQTIAEINKKLENKIEERTQALSQAYKELDTFFYRSSHDFRRPLTTFLGLAEVAKITVKDSSALELFEKVRETAVNLDKMLVKLQSISDVGSQQLVYREVFVKDIFDSVCDTFRDEIQRKNIRMTVETKMHDPFISYPAMIKTIIENLMENSISFCGTDSPYVKLTATQTSDYVTLEIQDNGQGIAVEYQEQIFDMYYRANERSKGNGLGLYIVKKAVEKLDGSISMNSIPLKGTTFTVLLPREYKF